MFLTGGVAGETLHDLDDEDLPSSTHRNARVLRGKSKEAHAGVRRERISKIVEAAVSALEHEFAREAAGFHTARAARVKAGKHDGGSTSPTMLRSPRGRAEDKDNISSASLAASLAATVDFKHLHERSEGLGRSLDVMVHPSSHVGQESERPVEPQTFLRLMPGWEELAAADRKSSGNQFLPDAKRTISSMSNNDLQSLDDDDLSVAKLKSTVAQTGEYDPRSAKMHCLRAMHPFSKFRMVWDFLACSFLAFDCYVIPLQSVFDVAIDSSSALFYPTLTAVIYWTVDVILSCILGYHLPDGQVELRLSHSFRRYFLSWFWPEVFILIADWYHLLEAQLDIDASAGVGDASRWITLLRLARFARLFRLHKLLRAIDIMQTYSTIMESTSLLLGISRNIFFIALLNHGIASIWYALGLQHINDGGWLAGRKSEDWLHNYVMAMQWSIANFTPGAASNSQTEATAEIAFHVFILFFALVVFSVFVSSTTALIASLVKMKSGRQQKMLRLKKYMFQHQIPVQLRDRVLRYASRILEQNRDTIKQQDVELLLALSAPLRQEVSCFSQITALRDHHFLRKLFHGHPALKIKICVDAVSEVLFSKGDVIFSTGETRDKMSCVVAGSMLYHKYSSRDDAPDLEREDTSGEGDAPAPAPWSLVTLREKEWYSEPAMWIYQWYCRGDMTAEDDCLTLDLSGQSLQKVIAAYPIESQFVVRYAAAFLKDLISTAQSSAGESDELSDLHRIEMEAEPEMERYYLPRGLLTTTTSSSDGFTGRVFSGGGS